MNTHEHSISILQAARTAWANRSDPESVRPLARVFWYVLLAAATLAVVALIAGAGVFFFDTLSLSAPADSLPVKRSQRLDRAKLDEVVMQINARQEAFTKHTLPMAIPPDPSI